MATNRAREFLQSMTVNPALYCIEKAPETIIPKLMALVDKAVPG